jgi:hypothetical protein
MNPLLLNQDKREKTTSEWRLTMKSETKNEVASVPQRLFVHFADVAIVRLGRCGGIKRSNRCLAFPEPIFEELCRRLLSRSETIDQTLQWLEGAIPNAPARSKLYGFADHLFAEFREVARDYVQGVH